jgi:hypothetical protein
MTHLNGKIMFNTKVTSPVERVIQTNECRLLEFNATELSMALNISTELSMALNISTELSMALKKLAYTMVTSC